MGGESILGALPIAGALGSAALQQHYSLKNWNRTNAYNAPKQQIERLKDAKLPLATMFGGSGGGTSSAPSTPNVDPTLGTAEGVGKYMLSQMQRKQMELLDNQIYTEEGRGKKEWSDALNSQTNAQRNNAQWQFELNSEGSDTVAPTIGASNLTQGMTRDRRMKQAELIGKNISNEIAEIDRNTKPAILSAQLTEILTRAGLTQQQIQLGNLNEKIANMLLDGQAGGRRLGALIDALIFKALK